MKIWLDDLRPAPNGWIWAKDSFTALAHLNKAMLKGWKIETISFDHDLGGDDTSRRVVLWMCENDFWPDVCYVHSANPVGIEWLTGMINRYGCGVSK